MRDLINFYDSELSAVINPADVISPVPDFPGICVSTFSAAIVDKFAAMDGVRIISQIYTANGSVPVYQTEYKGSPIAFYLSAVGAPACVAGFEEVHAMGAGTFVWFGSCGVLNHETVQDRLIIPERAIREDGTSYHYAPPAGEITQPETSVRALAAAMDQLNRPYVRGKVWTTDAIYRETGGKVREKRDSGCLAVEMECAALLAASQFRKVKFAQFLYTADSLSNESWEARDLSDHGLGSADAYMEIAFETGIRLHQS